MTPDPVDPLELPDAAAWTASYEGRPGLLDFVGVRVGLAGALAVAKVLRPDLIDFRGCVLLRERFSHSSFEEWWEQLDGDVPEIESVVNHLHLWDLFEVEDEDVLADRALGDLAVAIASSWRCLLAETYPDRRFHVRVTTSANGDYGPTISFASTSEEFR
ncbi:MAG: hypothetical protein KDB26_11140 [Microthrixaceae bacterium]|nr:hypothetical protein [Microthrixaceae bacterium]